MATTSPDNIRTPDPGDPYNLVPDLQTLAQDVQDALIARGNVFKGTAAQRAAFLSTASPGMLWQDTDGIGMLWKRGASQWVPAVWRWSGTTAQMNGFTQAPDGFEWYNTTTNSTHLRIGGSWLGSGWVPLTIYGGASGHYSPASKVHDGVVYIRGAVSGTTPGSAVSVATLPVGHRPSVYMWYPSSTNTNYSRSFNINENGVMQVWKHPSDTTGSYVPIVTSFPVI